MGSPTFRKSDTQSSKMFVEVNEKRENSVWNIISLDANLFEDGIICILGFYKYNQHKK